MEVERLWAAVDLVRNEGAVLSARQVTYLRTYPALLKMWPRTVEDPLTKFLQLSTAAYGWMPRVIRMEASQIDPALESLIVAARATDFASGVCVIEPVAACLYSVVGASKVLHFVNPDVYPIWDAKVQRVWGRTDPSQRYMSQPRNYIDYAEAVHRLCAIGKSYDEFSSAFRSAHRERLTRLRIQQYDIGDIRVVESAAFEVSGGEYEDD